MGNVIEFSDYSKNPRRRALQLRVESQRTTCELLLFQSVFVERHEDSQSVMKTAVKSADQSQNRIKTAGCGIQIEYIDPTARQI